MLINNDTIIKDTDPILRHKSEPVKLPLNNDDIQLLNEMFTYVKESTDPELAEAKKLRPAVGISAIQVGIPRQLTAIIVKEKDKNGSEAIYQYMLANPRIVSSSVQKAYLESGEGCLSVVEEHAGYIIRSARITVRGYDLITNKEITVRARGYLSIVLQHELDHFKGILFYDYINKNNPFPKVTDAIVI